MSGMLEVSGFELDPCRTSVQDKGHRLSFFQAVEHQGVVAGGNEGNAGSDADVADVLVHVGAGSSVNPVVGLLQGFEFFPFWESDLACNNLHAAFTSKDLHSASDRDSVDRSEVLLNHNRSVPVIHLKNCVNSCEESLQFTVNS